MNFRLFFLFVIAVGFQSTYSQIDTDLLNKYQALSNSQLYNQDDAALVLKQYRKALQKDTVDTLNSSNIKFNKPLDSVNTSADVSVYQQIIKGKPINPDSLLKNIEIFGHSIFSQSQPSTFSPGDAASVPANYPINSGDEITVMLWGRINEEYKVAVSRDGSINIPRIGPVSVAGLSYGQMQKNILDRVGKIEGVNVTVSMGKLRTIGIYIVGEVTSPGFYTISALSNVTNALFAAGGPTKNGSLRNIQLKRNGIAISTIDFYDFLLSGNDNTGLRLQSGDVIFVPIARSMAAVVGNVRRSALYELQNKTNLQDLINLAGGITPSAWINKIQIERFDNNDYRTILDLDSSNGKIPEFAVKDGDIIKIFPVLEKDKNTVFLTGNVLRPGKYEFHQGMKLKDIISDYSVLLPETYFNYAVIMRQEPPSYLDRIIPFNLKSVLDSSSSESNIELKEKDKIVVYNKDYFEPDRSVFIDGSVTKPGKYKLLDNMTIRDLILEAGGLSDDASPTRGELYRRVDTKNEVSDVNKLDFCIECVMQNDPQSNIPLLRSDRIFIRSKVGWETEKKVTLRGQFTYPGTYVLFNKESLGDLIKRAGGFKDDAYLAAAVFSRKSVMELEKKRNADYSRDLESEMIKISTEKIAKDNPLQAQELLKQQMAIKSKIDSSSASGRIVIDFTNENACNDFLLEDGDDIYIPRNLNTVSVLGEVYNPSTFKYNTERRDVSTFLQSAGGFKENAEKKKIYVIKANGKIITNKTVSILDYQLDPGDAVVVPAKLNYSDPHKRFVDTAAAIANIALTLGTIVTLISGVIQLRK